MTHDRNMNAMKRHSMPGFVYHDNSHVNHCYVDGMDAGDDDDADDAGNQTHPVGRRARSLRMTARSMSGFMVPQDADQVVICVVD